MYKNNELLVQLNLLEKNMIKLGDGLRFSFITFNELQKHELYPDKWCLYNMLTDMHTFNFKKSLEHFIEYITYYLVNSFSPNFEYDNFNLGNISCFKIKDEVIMGQTLIPVNLFSYLHSTFWEQIVNYAIYNFFEGPNNYTTQYFEIPFDEYCSFYNYKNFKSSDDITAKFLSDISDFLSFNHILSLKDFEMADNGLDLILPIKFDFKSLL